VAVPGARRRVSYFWALFPIEEIGFQISNLSKSRPKIALEGKAPKAS